MTPPTAAEQADERDVIHNVVRFIHNAWDGWCDLAGNDEAAFWIAATLLGGCAVLAFMLWIGPLP